MELVRKKNIHRLLKVQKYILINAGKILDFFYVYILNYPLMNISHPFDPFYH